jgi:hypothetical protein
MDRIVTRTISRLILGQAFSISEMEKALADFCAHAVTLGSPSMLDGAKLLFELLVGTQQRALEVVKPRSDAWNSIRNRMAVTRPAVSCGALSWMVSMDVVSYPLHLTCTVCNRVERTVSVGRDSTWLMGELSRPAGRIKRDSSSEQAGPWAVFASQIAEAEVLPADLCL